MLCKIAKIRKPRGLASEIRERFGLFPPPNAKALDLTEKGWTASISAISSREPATAAFPSPAFRSSPLETELAAREDMPWLQPRECVRLQVRRGLWTAQPFQQRVLRHPWRRNGTEGSSVVQIRVRREKLSRSGPIDQAGDHRSAETVVDVHNSDVGRTTVEHAQQCRETAEAGAIANACRHRDNRNGDEAADDAWEPPPSPRRR